MKSGPTFHKKITAQLFLAILAGANVLTLALSARPIQDDYSILSNLATKGFLGGLKDSWNTMGGNVAPLATRSAFLSPSLSGKTWVGLFLFTLFVAVMVSISSALLMRSFSKTYFSRQEYFIVVALTILGFEGLLSPGAIGAFQFGAASAVHLLSVCYGVIAISLCFHKSKLSFLGIAIFGVACGNSSLAESLTLFAVCISLLVNTYFSKSVRFSSPRNSRLIVLIIANVLGLVTIVIAPGFRNRANNQIGVKNSLDKLPVHFVTSFIDIVGDFIAHPIWIFALIFGLLNKQSSNTFTIRRRFIIFPISFILLLDIVGGSLAYPAWHQTLGIYVLATPLCYIFASSLPRNSIFQFVRNHSKTFTIFVLLFLSLQFVRILPLSVSRAEKWDRNFVLNSCSLKKDPAAQLRGAEILYPPLNVGVSDVNTWTWMADSYRIWVRFAVSPPSNC
jgi:hypothetical protein